METFHALLSFSAGNSPVTGEFPAQGQWRGPFMLYLICAWTDSWANNGGTGDLGRYRAYYDVIVKNVGTEFASHLVYHSNSQSTERAGANTPARSKDIVSWQLEMPLTANVLDVICVPDFRH